MSIPAPPPMDPRHRRHSTKSMQLARRLYGDGDSWTPSQIRRYLREQHGVEVALSTVRGWVIPGVAEDQRRRNRESRRRQAAAAPVPVQRGSLDERMLALRQLGLTFPGIAIVLGEYHGMSVDAEYVRSRLRRYGVPKNPSKVAAGRAVWERRKAMLAADDLRAAA